MDAQRYGARLHQPPCLTAAAIFSSGGMLGTALTAENQEGMKALTLYSWDVHAAPHTWL